MHFLLSNVSVMAPEEKNSHYTVSPAQTQYGVLSLNIAVGSFVRIRTNCLQNVQPGDAFLKLGAFKGHSPNRFIYS